MKSYFLFILVALLLAGCTKLEENAIPNPVTPEKKPGYEEEKPSPPDAENEENVPPQALDGTDMTEFFLNDGTKAYFKGEGNEFATYTTETKWLDDHHVVVYEDNGGVKLARIYRLEKDKIVVLKEEPVEEEVTPPTVAELEGISPARTYLAFPLAKGAEFDQWTVTAVDAELETPLRPFSNVIVLEQTHEDGAVSRSYFAIGFGEIKREYIGNTEDDNTFEVTSEIEKIE